MDELAILDDGILRAIDAGQWDDALALASDRDTLIRKLAHRDKGATLDQLMAQDATLVATVVRARDQQRDNLSTFRKALTAAQAYASS
ncbi:MAG: flagellar protein FliT [Pseudomonadota bacterium]